jgi:hypothetical protein
MAHLGSSGINGDCGSISQERWRQWRLRQRISRAAASMAATTVNFKSDGGYRNSELNRLGSGGLTGGLLFLKFIYRTGIWCRL